MIENISPKVHIHTNSSSYPVKGFVRVFILKQRISQETLSRKTTTTTTTTVLPLACWTGG